MAVRKTIERVLRDPDDAAGQTIRQWTITAEPHHVMIKLNHGDGFILLRPADVPIFNGDLLAAKKMAEEGNEE